MYHNTQPASSLTIFLLIAFFILILVFWVTLKEADINNASRQDQVVVYSSMAVASFVMLVFLLLFNSLTVYDDGESLNIRLGIGLISRKIPYNRIKTVETAKHPWWMGFGIRRIPHGWAYILSGSNVVRLTMKDGKVIAAGSNEPETLKQVIESHIEVQKPDERRF